MSGVIWERQSAFTITLSSIHRTNTTSKPLMIRDTRLTSTPCNLAATVIEELSLPQRSQAQRYIDRSLEQRDQISRPRHLHNALSTVEQRRDDRAQYIDAYHRDRFAENASCARPQELFRAGCSRRPGERLSDCRGQGMVWQRRKRWQSCSMQGTES